MVRDALKNYLALASGLTEVGKQRANAAAKALVAQGEATAEQVSSLADDLIQTSKANRELLTAVVRSEVDKALARVGLATADEVRRLTRRLHTVESMLRDVAANVSGNGGLAPAGGTAGSGNGAAAKPAAAKAATAKPAAAARPAAAAKKAPAKKAAATTAPAQKAPASKAPAKQAAAKRASARKATP